MFKSRTIRFIGSLAIVSLIFTGTTSAIGAGKSGNNPSQENANANSNANSNPSASGASGAPSAEAAKSKESTGQSSSSSSNSNANQNSNSSSRSTSKKESSESANSTTTCQSTVGKSKVSETCSDFIIVFTPGSSVSARANAVSAANSKVIREYSNVFKGALINGPAAKIAALRNNPNVKFLEADATVKSTVIDTSPGWGLDRIDQRTLPLSSTFDDGDRNATGIKVYIVDTGINTQHSEFSGRVDSGYSAVTGGVEDCNGHGTHVSGIVAGSKYGVAKGAVLVPVRVLDCTGSGSYSSVIAGLDWIAANAPLGTSAVVNMSLGGAASSTIDSAVKNLISRGLSVVVAAGNSSTDACTASPARVTEAITVGATGITDQVASYSNIGSCLDVFAPGSGITSSWIGSTTASSTLNGTSMASPLVAGIVARFIASNPTLAPSQIASSLRAGATQNVLTQIGTGSLNLLAYLNFAYDGSSATQPVDVPQTSSPTTSTGSKKPTTSPGKKK